jgi:Cof subfamily protein (haloacid dehalogenase superfamily)
MFWAGRSKGDNMEPHKIRLFVSDVDGTLLNTFKKLSPATIKAIRDLRRAGIHFSLISHRPLQGLRDLMDELQVEGACAALNGGVIVDQSFTVVSEKNVRAALVQGVVGVIERHGLDPWIYTRSAWYVPQSRGLHVQRESQALRFSPTTFETLADIPEPIIKIAGVGDDYSQISVCQDELKRQLGGQLSVLRTLPNHLDISHPDANKGAAVASIAAMLDIPLDEVASAGDGENDIPMFRVSKVSIAMGQAPPEVHRAASDTTTSNAQDGLAWAIQDLILRCQPAEQRLTD